MRLRTPVLLLLVGALMVAGCRRTQSPSSRPSPSATSSPPPRPSRFTDDVRLRTTPVKDQGESSLCWAYAMLATIESEHLMQGDSVNLSPHYVARYLLLEQARANYARKGGRAFTTRGMGQTLVRLLRDHGIVPWQSYRIEKNLNYNVLCRRMQTLTADVVARRLGLAALGDRVTRLLDQQMGTPPRYVFMEGCEYTAVEFAHSVCRPSEYEAVTSFSHHPFGSRFALEVPDNTDHSRFLNVPIDSMVALVSHAIASGHAVCWEGDISEPGFRFDEGTAELVRANHPASQEERQREFERFQTTDDHCMAIVGMAHDGQGQRYYVMKNSWGETNPYGGYMYMSENYLRLKTIALFVPKDAMGAPITPTAHS